MEPLWTETQLAEYLQKSVITVRKNRWQGKGPPFLNIAGSIRYRPEDVKAFLEGRINIDNRRQNKK